MEHFLELSDFEHGREGSKTAAFVVPGNLAVRQCSRMRHEGRQQAGAWSLGLGRGMQQSEGLPVVRVKGIR
jgi:hypothetical protein